VEGKVTAAARALFSRILFSCLLATAPAAVAQAASLVVSVVDATCAAVADATIVVTPATTSVGRALRTDGTGRASITDLPDGATTLRVERVGFVPREVRLELDGREQTVTVRLDVSVAEFVAVEGAATTYRAVLGATAAKVPGIPARDIPFAIEAVSQQVLEDQRVTSVNEALKNVSGVGQQPGWGGINSRYTLRGFGNPSQLKNGFRQNLFIPITDMANIEQVEVLKGPASALYGSFEPGGVVSLLTKRPLDQHRGSFEFDGGSFATARPTIDVTGPLNRSKTLLYRFNLSYTRAESHRDFVEYDATFAAPAIEWHAAFRFDPAHASRQSGVPGTFEAGCAPSCEVPVGCWLSTARSPESPIQ
jgi:outer membrane receptor protein involved in Fe transport